MQLAPEQHIGVRGDIEIKVLDGETRQVLRQIDVRNLIVTNGLLVIGNLLKGYVNPADVPQLTWLFVADGTTPPTPGDTNLASPNTVQCPLVTTVDVVGSKLTVACAAQLETTQGNGLTISEAGLFVESPSLASSGMIARQVFTGIAKTSAIALQLTWRITFTA